jgi:hypothetical protein
MVGAPFCSERPSSASIVCWQTCRRGGPCKESSEPAPAGCGLHRAAPPIERPAGLTTPCPFKRRARHRRAPQPGRSSVGPPQRDRPRATSARGSLINESRSVNLFRVPHARSWLHERALRPQPHRRAQGVLVAHAGADKSCITGTGMLKPRSAHAPRPSPSARPGARTGWPARRRSPTCSTPRPAAASATPRPARASEPGTADFSSPDHGGSGEDQRVLPVRAAAAVRGRARRWGPPGCVTRLVARAVPACLRIDVLLRVSAIRTDSP